MEFLPAFLLFAATAAFTPGPNNIMIMSSGLNFGVRASVPHLLGICFGFPLMIIALGLGAGVLFVRFPWLHEAIKILGIAYLLYLAWRIATSAPGSLDGGRSRPFTFLQAALFQWINPKAWIMGSSALATYTTVGGNMFMQVGIIVAVFHIMAWASAGTWLYFGAGLKRVLQRPLWNRVFNVTMALLLVASMYGVIAELYVRHIVR